MCKGKFRQKIYLLAILYIGYVCGDLDNPCPHIWTYTMVNNDLRGVIEVPSPKSNVLKLGVQLAVGNKVEGYNGQIQLFASKDQSAKDFSEAKPIKYIVRLPIWFKNPPKVTRIQVNGETVCYGPGLSLSQVAVLTTIDLEHTLTINSPPRRVTSGSNYPINPSNDNPPHRLQENVFLKDIIDGNSQNGPNSFYQRPSDTVNNYYKPQYFNYPYDTNPYYNSNHYYNRKYYTTGTTQSSYTDDTFLQKLPSNQNAPAFHHQNNFAYNTKPLNDVTTAPILDRIPTVANRQVFAPQDNPIDSDIKEAGSTEGCGVTERSVVQLLAHAVPVVDVRYPWLVAIFIKSERSLNFACGGSLISYRHVISAAHCFPDNDPEMYQFVMSDNMRQLFSFENKTVREALHVFRHPQYLPKSADADLAIAVLRTSVPKDRHIRPVCLWSEKVDIKLVVGQYGKVVGWGQDENNQLSKKNPKEVNMPILDTAECIQSNPLFNDFVTERSFCAGYKNGTGPCFGDSGSGFFMNRNGRYTLRGIISITILDNVAECKISEYSALTDVSKFSDWVNSILTIQ